MDLDDSGASIRLESTSLTPISSNGNKCSNDDLHRNGIQVLRQPGQYTNNKPSSGADDSILENDFNTSNGAGEEVELRVKQMEMTFDYLDAASLVFSMFSFLIDYMTDIAVAIFHYLNQDYWYSALTTIFVFVPNLITSVISLRWYWLDPEQPDSVHVGRFQWTLRIVFHILQVGPILRYYESLQHGLAFREATDKKEKEKAYMRMLHEDADATMLRLLESFMESAPQLMLQMYIIAKNYPFEDSEHWTVALQIVSICSSLISISWSLVSYQKSLRNSLDNKIPMTYPSIAVLFSWELSSVAARMIALALFTSVFVRTVGFVMLVHWAIMTTWIISMRTQFCETKCEELGFNAVLGVIFIFCYLNPIDSPTRFRYLAFYVFMFLENSLLMFSWARYAPYKIWVKDVAVSMHYATFFLGIVMMLIYYRWFHPTGGIRIDRSKA